MKGRGKTAITLFRVGTRGKQDVRRGVKGMDVYKYQLFEPLYSFWRSSFA